MLCMQRHANSILYAAYALSFVLMVFSFVVFFYYYKIDMHLRESSNEKYLQHDSYMWEYTFALFMFYANANSMVLFRMFGLHLVTIIVHATIHVLVFMMMILQITYLHNYNKDGGYRGVEKTFYMEYPYSCFMVISAYLLQIIMSLHLIVFRPGHTLAQREQRSGMHAFLGIITFIIIFWNIMVHVSMLCIANPHVHSTAKDIPQDNLLWEPQVIALFLMLYLLLMFFILLTPFFRYDSKTCYDSDEYECCALETASSITIELNSKLPEDQPKYCDCKVAPTKEVEPCPPDATSCPLRKRNAERMSDSTKRVAGIKCSKCSPIKPRNESADHIKSCKSATAPTSCPLKAKNTESSSSLTQRHTKHTATSTADIKQYTASNNHQETINCTSCASPRGAINKITKCSPIKHHADFGSSKAATAPNSPTSCPLRVHNKASSCFLPLQTEDSATQMPDMKHKPATAPKCTTSCPLRVHNKASSCSLPLQTEDSATQMPDMKRKPATAQKCTTSCPLRVHNKASICSLSLQTEASATQMPDMKRKPATAPNSPKNSPLRAHNKASSCSLPLQTEALATQMADMKRCMTSLPHEESFNCPSCSKPRATAKTSAKLFQSPKQKAELGRCHCEPSPAKRSKRSAKKTLSSLSLQKKPNSRNLHAGSRSMYFKKPDTAKHRTKPVKSSLTNILEVRRRIYVPPAKAPTECLSTTTLETHTSKSCLKVMQYSEEELDVSASEGSSSPDSVQEEVSRHYPRVEKSKPSGSKKPKRKLTSYECQQVKGHCTLARFTGAPDICYESDTKRAQSLPRNAGGSNRKWSESVPRRSSSLPRDAIFSESAASTDLMSSLNTVGSRTSASQLDVEKKDDDASHFSWYKKISRKFKTKK